ncbi:glycoside hydrolase, partial [Streptomyces cavourensis]
MSRRLLRAVCTAALAAALVVSPATAAPAEPNPVPPVDTGEAPGDAAEVDAETALAAPEAPEALGAPKGVATLLRELQTLYQEAEEASETYNATAEKLKQRTAEAKKVGTELAKARAALE